MKLRDCCGLLTPADFPVAIPVPGRFADVDARNHVNNIALARLFSEARSHVIGRFKAAAGAKGILFVVGQQAVFYAGETHYPGTIEIGCGLVGVGGSSIRFVQALFNEGRCTALTEAILVAGARGGTVPIDAPLRAAMAAYAYAGPAIPRQLAPLD